LLDLLPSTFVLSSGERPSFVISGERFFGSL
jgi:hypothetical protein